MDRIGSFNGLNRIESTNLSNVSSGTALFHSGAFQAHKTEPATRNKILNKLPKKVLEIFLACAESVYFECGESVYRPQDEIRFVNFPETAVFSEYKIIEDGRIIEVLMTGREGVTGTCSMLNEHRSETFTKVLQAGYALQIDGRVLNEKLNAHAEVKHLIFDYFNQFIDQISQRVICSGFHQIENRLCSWLLMLQDRTGSRKLNLTHEQIALSLGVHRPSITQITKKLREQEMIDYLRGTISVLNRSKLENAACSCYKAII